MPTLQISKASAVRWIIETGSGTINENAILPDNEFYPGESQVCGIYFPEFSQLYSCSDLIKLQIYFDDGSNYPYIVIYDADKNIVYASEGVENGVSNYYDFTIDFSEITCDACYYMELWDVSAFGGNLFTDGDSGTFETNILNISTGTENAVIRDNTQARTGSWSAKVTNGGTKIADAEDIIRGDTVYTLTANQVYVSIAWVYIPTLNSFASNAASEIFIDIEAEWTDAQIVSQTVWTPATGFDGWKRIETRFVVFSDTKGQLRIQLNDRTYVNTSGIIWIDDIELKQMNPSVEATSENIQVVSDVSCWPLINYYCDSDDMQATFENSFQWSLRIPMNFLYSNIENDSDVFIDSAGTRTKIFSQTSQRSTWDVGYMPNYLIEIFSMALEHDHFLIDSVEYISQVPYEPDNEDRYGLRKGTHELYLSDFNYKNALC